MVYIKIDALQVLCLSFITLTNIDIKIPPKIHWNFWGISSIYNLSFSYNSWKV